MSRHPEVKWAQKPDKVYLTVMLADAKNAKVNLEPEGKFTCTATAGSDNNAYEIKLDLFDKVNVEESKISIGVRSIFCVIEKTEVNWWNKLLKGDGKAPHYVKVDWDKWVDEDDDGPAAPPGGDMDMGGMDFSSMMGGMGGGMGDMMGGMGGMGDMMGGMGGMGGMMGGMGGMGGMMGGMGGMGDMMGGMDDVDDDDEEEDDADVSKPVEEEEKAAEGKAKAAPST